MSETLNDTGGAPATTAAPAAAAPAAAPVAAAPAAPASPAASPAAPADKLDARAPVSPAERAVRRAQARIDKQTSTAPGMEQAAASTDDGASTPAPAGSDAETSPPAATGGEPTPAPDSIAAAPQDWPAEYRERFDKLPDDARTLALDFYKDMQGGFTQAMQKVSTQAKALGNVSSLMEQHGVDAAYVSSVMDKAVAFNTDPKATLKQLAAEAGVEVYFEPPATPGEVPKFETAAEMAAWVAQETERKIQASMTAEREASQTALRKSESEAAFRAELKDAEKLPDFLKMRAPVLDKLESNPMLSVEDAYWLVALPALQKQAGEAAVAKKELAALKAKIEGEAKRNTQPPNGQFTGKPVVDEATLSPGQRAHRRAQAKIAARGSSIRA